MIKRNILVILLLVLFSLGLYRTFNQLHSTGYGLFYLKTNGNTSDLVSKKDGELLKRDIVSGKFHSKYANLGTVSIRFNNHNRDSDDTLIFRIKDESSPHWQYQAEYKTDQFLPGELFPFGFPIIKDSADKTYFFELESQRGEVGKGIYLDSLKPTFVAVSFFDRNELSENWSKMLVFLAKKILNAFGSTEDLVISLVNFTPFFLFLAYVLSLEIGFFITPLVIITCVFFDVFVLPISSSYFLTSAGLLWIVSAFNFKYGDEISMVAALIFVSLSPLLWVLNLLNFAEKTANWAFLFFVIGMFQQIYQYKQNAKKYLGIHGFIKDIKKAYVATPKIKKLMTWAAILIVYFAVVNIILKANRSLNIYYTFYPNLTPLALYLFYFSSILILLSLPYFIYHLHQTFVKYAFFVIFLSLSITQVFGIGLANLTSFEHQPKIFFISPSSTSEAWVDINIHGKNFQDKPFVGKVYIDGVEQGEYVIDWEDGKIVVRTSPAITRSGSLCITTYSRGKSNCLPFEYRFGQENKLK